jgi:hypothetical protein
MNHTIKNDVTGVQAFPHRLGTDEFGRVLYCAPGSGWTVIPPGGHRVEHDADGNYVIAADPNHVPVAAGDEIEVVVLHGFGAEDVYSPAVVIEAPDELGGIRYRGTSGEGVVFDGREGVDWRRPAPTTFAAVGTDGRRPVVWGAGSTPEAAMDDARAWLRATNPEWNEGMEALETHPITAAQLRAIDTGDVSWPPK